jgi:tetratricopeptide (TPR) repeat protein
VVNDDGVLVAVTHGGSQAASLLNLAIDVTEVQTYLKENEWLGRARTPAQHVDRAAHFYRRPFFRNVGPRHDRPDLALIDLDYAIKLDNRSADYYISRAEVRERIAVSSSAGILIAIGLHQPAPAAVKETLDRAMQDIDAALKLNPKSAPAYARRSSIIHTQHICRIEGADDEKASAALLQALRLDPSYLIAIEQVAKIVGADDPALAIKC